MNKWSSSEGRGSRCTRGFFNAKLAWPGTRVWDRNVNDVLNKDISTGNKQQPFIGSRNAWNQCRISFLFSQIWTLTPVFFGKNDTEKLTSQIIGENYHSISWNKKLLKLTINCIRQDWSFISSPLRVLKRCFIDWSIQTNHNIHDWRSYNLYI